MQGKHMLVQVDKKPPAAYGGDFGGRPDMAVVLRVEALDQEGLLHRLVDRIRALCKGQEGHDARTSGGGIDATPGGGGAGGGGGARLEQYGLRGHTGSAVMEFLVAGAVVSSRGGRGWGEGVLMPYTRYGRSVETIGPRIPTMPGRRTVEFHRPDKHRLHQAEKWGRLRVPFFCLARWGWRLSRVLMQAKCHDSLRATLCFFCYSCFSPSFRGAARVFCLLGNLPRQR